ncbi:hypothetical protein QA639_35275 [Bradyrhizobium pachyrhizi]|uniref:hypothetical protein n=1 Tax=Bradyrhizobium pachyrhizi TaxID=280333 RepID=UPI0024B06175|nr:hypothetical protein [Bradyrhizobium pachyrhizi]WFU54788.1 hypothetical protein QA639_35275 [Bradyrhizobium pachyrhizi]
MACISPWAHSNAGADLRRELGRVERCCNMPPPTSSSVAILSAVGGEHIATGCFAAKIERRKNA